MPDRFVKTDPAFCFLQSKERGENFTMKIKVLGTGAATGVPLMFCNCETCRRARIQRGKSIRKRSSILINDEMLLDLSPDLGAMAEMYNVDLGRIRYLVQTHSHSDHFDAGHFVTRWDDYGTQSLEHLNIVCSRGTCADMNHWVRENEPDMDLTDPRWQENMNFSLHLLKSGETVQLGEYRITGIDSAHDKRIESLVYVIEYYGKAVLYATDLLELTQEAWEILQRYHLDLAFLDHTYGLDQLHGGHMNESKVAAAVEKMRALGIADQGTQIYGTHLSHEWNGLHEETEARAVSHGYHIAYDGLELTI